MTTSNPISCNEVIMGLAIPEGYTIKVEPLRDFFTTSKLFPVEAVDSVCNDFLRVPVGVRNGLKLAKESIVV